VSPSQHISCDVQEEEEEEVKEEKTGLMENTTL